MNDARDVDTTTVNGLSSGMIVGAKTSRETQESRRH